MGKINYKAIYEENQFEWHKMTTDPHKYEALLAGHYSEKNHFVYELLQNAEDENATKCVIEYYSDKLVFYHNGDPFDEKDVVGVSSMLMGTKDSEDAQTIGRFGMGFKSVFKYTYQPEIYSDNEAFKICNFLLPVELENGWDFKKEMKKLQCKTAGGSFVAPFENEEHLTKFIIPFKKYDKKGNLTEVSGTEVLEKLRELSGEILLFLSHIKSLYWINMVNGLYSYITAEQDPADSMIYTCRIEGSNLGDKEEISRYIRFTKVLDHPEMKNSEVSVAYKLNNRADNINGLEGTDICVYFPTRERTGLPFLIHGSFETAVSREKLMTPSSFNDDMFDMLGDLIADSLLEIARRKLLTQNFIREIIIPAFADERVNGTISGLTTKITDKFKTKKIIPIQSKEYAYASECYIPVPFRIADFKGRTLFDWTFEDKKFVQINNENQANFQEYFNWLWKELKMPTFTLYDWAKTFDIFEGYEIEKDSEEFDQLTIFYIFLSDYRESVYSGIGSVSRKGNYDLALINMVSKAWAVLRQKPLILNQLYTLVPAMNGEDLNIYLGASSDLKDIPPECLVNEDIEEYGRTLRDGFGIAEFDDLQYVKEKVLNKYKNVEDSIIFDSIENVDEEYIYDIKQVLSVLSGDRRSAELQSILNDSYIIKIKPQDEDEGFTFEVPYRCYLPKSKEGLDMELYFTPVLAGLTRWSEDYEYYDFNRSIVDIDFFKANGITEEDLLKLGVRNTPVIEGKKQENGIGDGYWIAIDKFCPYIDIYGIEKNIWYINAFPNEELSQRKSATILQFLLNIANKLRGKKRYRKNTPYISSSIESADLYFDIMNVEWVYDENMEVNYLRRMSRYEINKDLYKDVSASKESFELLGFVEKEMDTVETAIRRVDELDEEDQRRLLKSLATKFGMELSEIENKEEADDDWDTEGDMFDPGNVIDESFPIRPVRNLDYLKKHVYEQFYCADPVTYEKVLRKIRTSKSAKNDRAYVEGMYANSGNQFICQMCKKPTEFHETIQISNFGIEMPQLNLCLCRDCAAAYKAYLQKKGENYNKDFKAIVYDLNINGEDGEITIELDPKSALHFTQTHVAELQEIFFLLDKYGLPKKGDYEPESEKISGPVKAVEFDNNSSNEENHKMQKELEDLEKGEDLRLTESSVQSANPSDDVIRAGSLVSYKKIGSKPEIVDNFINPKKYPLHQKMMGHKIGDVIMFMGKKYEIISILN